MVHKKLTNNERENRAAGEKKETKEFNREEKNKALAFLKDPELHTRTLEDFRALKIVGESRNILLTYLVGLSRSFPNPLSIYFQSASSAGKTTIVNALKKLTPRDDYLSITSFSDNALYYIEEKELQHKIFFLGEDVHSDEVKAQIRQLQTEKELSKSAK